MARFDLNGFEWTVVEPFLANKPRGVPRVNDSQGPCMAARSYSGNSFMPSAVRKAATFRPNVGSLPSVSTTA